MIRTNRNVRIRPWWRPAGWHWIILLIGIAGVGWAVVSPSYYCLVLSGEKVDVHIFCDTSDLDVQDLKAFVLYDQVALSPIALALGLYQNRPPEQVKVFFFRPANEVVITPVSIRLKSVCNGPIARVFFVAGGKKFHVDVGDRRLIDNTIYVRSSG